MTGLVSLQRLQELDIRYDAKAGTFTRAGKLIATAIRPDGYAYATIDYRAYSLHRLAWFMMTGRWPAAEIVHSNNQRADNKWENLRLASASQRAQRRVKPNRLGVRGVRLTKAGKYRATIFADRRTINLGTFTTVEAASAAYSDAALKYYGSEARTK